MGSGRIINVSSLYGITEGKGEVAYSTAKAGIIGLTKSVAKECGQDGVTLNAVLPGLTRSPTIETVMAERYNKTVEGALNMSSVYPREIKKSAIKHNAVALIFVHNHPSGSPEPSPSDKDITKDLIAASNAMQIKVLDHIVIVNNEYFSFADEGLIEEYNMNFLNIKKEGKDRL